MMSDMPFEPPEDWYPGKDENEEAFDVSGGAPISVRDQLNALSIDENDNSPYFVFFVTDNEEGELLEELKGNVFFAPFEGDINFVADQLEKWLEDKGDGLWVHGKLLAPAQNYDCTMSFLYGDPKETIDIIKSDFLFDEEMNAFLSGNVESDPDIDDLIM